MKKITYVLAAAMIIMLLAGFTANVENIKKIPILLYHNITETYPEKDNHLHTQKDTFREHINELKAKGFTAIDFDTYYKWSTGEGSLPEKPVIITFDDGYTSNYTEAFPVLKELNMKATIFVVTGRMGSRETVYPHFTWEEAREMQQSGVIDIESHTDTHRALGSLSEEEQALEMRISRTLIERNMNKTCGIIAFPFGDFFENTVEIAHKAGYKVVCKVGDMGVNTYEDKNTPLKRLTVFGDMSGAELIEMIEENMR